MSEAVWYGKLSGRFWRHPKALALSPAAGWLWTRALSYVVDQRTDPVAGNGTVGIDLPHLASDFEQRVVAEGRQTHLHRPWVVEARVSTEIDMQSLRQWCEALNTLRAFIESLGAGDQEVQARKAAGVDLVDPLAQRVQAPLAGIGTHTLQGLDFIQDQQQTAIPRVAQHG